MIAATPRREQEEPMSALEKDTVAVVTGGARGIGLAIADALLAEGVAVACLDVEGADVTELEAASERHGVPVLSIPVDVRDREAVYTAVRRATELGPVRYAVNSAGIDKQAPTETVVADDWQQVVDIDLNGVLFSCQAEHEVMREHGGSIVNIASMSGYIVNRGIEPHVAYGAAKAGVIHLTKGLGVEWASEGVRVNSVSPGYVRTIMTLRLPEEMRVMFSEQTPLGRMADVKEIAAPVLFLLGSGASYVTATDLLVDGGFTAW
jgi:NAD(P)-dependent dehydrogenase (short-subunit alcohol dehydrogenase family)